MSDIMLTLGRYYRNTIQLLTATLDILVTFMWDNIHSSINNIINATMYFLSVSLPLVLAIGIGALIFKILSLAAAPIGLVYTIIIVMTLIFLANMEYTHAIGWFASLCCLYSFMLAGSAIIPTVIATIALGFLAEALFYGMYAFFQIEMCRHNRDDVKGEFTLARTSIDKVTYMIAETVAIMVMVFIFKITSAAIITATAPYAVAILGAIGMAMATLFFTQKAYETNIFNENFILKYIIDTIQTLDGTEKRSQLTQSFTTAFLVAIATFAALASLSITLVGAPTLVAILIAVGSSIAIQHTIIALPLLATKLMGEARQPVAIKSLIDEEKIGKKEKAGQGSTPGADDTPTQATTNPKLLYNA